MQTYTNYLPALPRVRAPERISVANPWPNDKTIMASARAWFVYSCRPARPFPALAHVEAQHALWCPIDAMPAKKRVATEELPAMTMQEWWHAYERAPRDIGRPPEPLPRAPRKLARVHAFLDRLIAWRQGLGKPKQPPEPAYICSECGEPLTEREAWQANESSKLLCGKCWLLQETW